jgi:hypothetical protein
VDLDALTLEDYETEMDNDRTLESRLDELALVARIGASQELGGQR